MNEELQSTNEELETVNEELRRRSDELKRVNAFLESILASLRGGVVVVDPEFLVLIWNRKAEDLWGLRPDEVRGRNLLNLDIGLPVEQLKSALRACLSGESPLPGGRPAGDQPPGQGRPLPRDLHADDRRRRRQGGHPGHGRGRDGPPGGRRRQGRRRRPARRRAASARGAGRRLRSAHGLEGRATRGREDCRGTGILPVFFRHGLEGRATRSASARGTGRREAVKGSIQDNKLKIQDGCQASGVKGLEFLNLQS